MTPEDQEREGRILELGSEVAQAREGGGFEVALVLAGGELQRHLLTQRVVVGRDRPGPQKLLQE